jgi:hypothetical protein
MPSSHSVIFCGKGHDNKLSVARQALNGGTAR